MIKSHFRLKLGEGQLYPEVAQLLDEDCNLQVENLAKRIYKTSKQTLVDQLLHRSRKVPINVNTIIALLNDSQFHDSRLSAIFKERDVYNDGREESLGESWHYEMKPLIRHNVFQMCTKVDGSRLKEKLCFCFQRFSSRQQTAFTAGSWANMAFCLKECPRRPAPIMRIFWPIM